MELLGEDAQVEAHFGPFGDKSNHEKDRCTFCLECTIGSEIGSDAPIGTPS
jgi:hypothetical protein